MTSCSHVLRTILLLVVVSLVPHAGVAAADAKPRVRMGMTSMLAAGSSPRGWLSAGIAVARSFRPGERVPVAIRSSARTVRVRLVRDIEPRHTLLHVRRTANGRFFVRLPLSLQSDRYHLLIPEPGGQLHRLPVIVRNAAVNTGSPPPGTALVVWPYLTWRAYGGSDLDRDGQRDSWYSHWTHRRVGLAGDLGVRHWEAGHGSTTAFLRWISSRKLTARVQMINDLELGQLTQAELSRYAVVIFPGHSEYYTNMMLARVTGYRDGGGRILFLASNNFYREVAVSVRDNSVTLMAMTGRCPRCYSTRNGLRVDAQLTGAGYSGCCHGRGTRYRVTAEGFEAVPWLWVGTRVSGPGSQLGYASTEFDRAFPRMSPGTTVSLGTTMVMGVRNVVRSDMVFTTTPGGGEIFLSGSHQFLRELESASGRRFALVALDNLWSHMTDREVSPLVRRRTVKAGGGALRVGIDRAIDTLDPARALDLRSLQISRLAYAGLTRFEGTNVVGDLAVTWQRNRSGGVWTFRLRDGVRFSDGTPITASDVRRSWLRAMAQDTHSPTAMASMAIIHGAVAWHRGRAGADQVGVDALDDRTLRVRLEHPVPWLHQLVALPAYAVVPGGGAPDGTVSSGRYRVQEARQELLRLGTSGTYWDGLSPAPDEIHVVPLRAAGLCRALASSEVDLVLPSNSVPPGFLRTGTSRMACPGAPGITVSRTPRGAPTYLWFATHRSGFDDPRVRRAVAIALDRRQLAMRLGDGYAPLRTVAWNGSGGYRTISAGSSLSLDPDLVRSRRLLARAAPGWPGRPLTLAWDRSDPASRIAALRVRRDLSEIGVQIQLRPVAGAGVVARVLRTGRVDLGILGWAPEFGDAYNTFDLLTCTSNYNVARWCDGPLDALMRRAVRTMDSGHRHSIERVIERRLTGRAGAFPLAPLFSERPELRTGGVASGLSPSPLGLLQFAS